MGCRNNDLTPFNSLLKIEGKTLFYKELHDKGVTYLSDLVNENGGFKTIDEIWGQFNCRIKYHPTA